MNSAIRLSLSASALALSLGSCVHSHSDSHAPTYDPVFVETEPNGSAEHPDFIGEIRPGQRFLIEGHITELGPDLYDGFGFHVTEPSEVEVVLYSESWADLDFCLYDPYDDEFVACWETDLDPEVGFFDAPYVGEDLHIVVSSYAGSGPYVLEVIARPLYYDLAAPADDSAARERQQRSDADAPAESDSVRPADRWNGYRMEASPPSASAAQGREVGRLFVLDERGQAREVAEVRASS